MNINKEDLKEALGTVVDAVLERIFGGSDSAQSAARLPAPKHNFNKGQILVTTRQLESADGEIIIPAGTKAQYLGQNKELPKQFLDVAWLSQDVDDNGKRWKHTGFRLA